MHAQPSSTRDAQGPAAAIAPIIHRVESDHIARAPQSMPVQEP
ncbi:hypothetical protein BDSB_17620 [Burkholderia dolosa PC543]|nr:hypothetical protein BDSB_17620 [Burkholderia dolosa PC543]